MVFGNMQSESFELTTAPPPPDMSSGSWIDSMYQTTTLPPAPIISGSQQPAAPAFKTGATEPPPPQPPAPPASVAPSENSKKEAVEQELAQQKRTLAVQREEYFKKKISLTRELNRLKEQKRDLKKQGDSKNHDRILKENLKLQSEILEKLKSMDNVIEMLSNIIGDKAEIAELMKETSYVPDSPKKVEKKKKGRSRSPVHRKSDKVKPANVNVVHYDPELHWCSVCNVFPRTTADFLNHLHSEHHKTTVNGREELPEEEFTPWRTHESRESSPPVFKNAPSRRVPIRGVQFLVPTAAWYCSMCRTWLGDIDTANRHLRGEKHGANYSEYISQNPHWEVDWLTDRTRAYERDSEAKSRFREDRRPPAPTPAPLQQPKMENLFHKPEQVTQPLPPANFDIGNLGDRLLAMIAASSKIATPVEKQRSDSVSSANSNGSSEGRRKDKKKKKNKEKAKERDKKKSSSQDKSAQEKSLKEGKKPSGKDKSRDEDDDGGSEVSKNEPKGKFVGKSNEKEFWSGGRKESSERNYRSFEKSAGKQASKNAKGGSVLAESIEETIYGPKEPPKKQPNAERRRSPESEKRKRSPELERWKRTPDVDKRKRSPEHKRWRRSPEPEKKKRTPEPKKWKGKFYMPGRDDDGADEAPETIFEKKTSESAAKKKDVKKTSFVIPKAKLPFIGRMPILKKKLEPKAEAAALHSEAPPLIQVPLPGAVVDTVENEAATPVLLTSKRVISEKLKATHDDVQEVDMDIDDEPARVEGEVEVPKEVVVEITEVAEVEETPAAPTEKNELHKDFKDALDLLFPERKVEVAPSEVVEDPNAMAPQLSEGQPLAYPSLVGGFEMPMYPPPGMDPSHYQVPYYDQANAAAYMQHQASSYMMGYDQSLHQMYSTEYSHPPPHPVTTPEVPLPHENVQPENVSSEASDNPVKKKNPPGQRLRRHLRKKALEESLKNGQSSANESPPAEEESSPERPKKFRPEEMSELALLGIEEDDITAQSFY